MVNKWLHRPSTTGHKRLIIKAYLKRYGLQDFIETGTYLGDTLADVGHNAKLTCQSIELDQTLYQFAKNRFRNWPNVQLHQGDSGEILPKVVRNLSRPALFWLDGHYSGGMTAKGDSDTPIDTELRTILESGNKDHIILIDDVRCFDGTNGYPYLDQLLEVVRTKSSYRYEISADIFTPDASESE